MSDERSMQPEPPQSPEPRPVEPQALGEPQAPGDPTPEAPSAQPGTGFGAWMGSMWLYTLLRFGLFFALWGLMVLIGLRGLVAALVALLVSVPASLLLLARPRAAFSRQLEARLAARSVHRSDLATRLEDED